MRRYQFSTKKTRAYIHRAGCRRDLHDKGCWELDITPPEKEAHLGLIRTSDGKANGTVKHNMTKSKRSLYMYALSFSGMHDLNGLHPSASASMQLWNTYILPRLTYGLHRAMFSNTEKFQQATFRRLQRFTI